jgi:hypothetical protein
MLQQRRKGIACLFLLALASVLAGEADHDHDHDHAHGDLEVSAPWHVMHPFPTELMLSLPQHSAGTLEWAGVFTMGVGSHTMIYSKVGGKYASASLVLAIRRHEIHEDLGEAMKGAKDAVAVAQDEHCGHDHDRRGETKVHGCTETVEQGR